MGLEALWWGSIVRKKLPAPISHCRNMRCDLRENMALVREKRVN